MMLNLSVIYKSRGTPPIQRRCLRVSGDTGQLSFEVKILGKAKAISFYKDILRKSANN